MGLTSKSIMDENYAEKAILSATLAGDKGLKYDSKNNLILFRSKSSFKWKY